MSLYLRLRELEHQTTTIEPAWRTPKVFTLLQVGETTYVRKVGALIEWKNEPIDYTKYIVVIKSYLTKDEIPR